MTPDLERDALEALWTHYRDGDMMYVIAHPERSHPMTEMQAYAARSFLLQYADTLEPLWLARARQLLEGTRKHIAEDGPAWVKGTVLDQVRSNSLVDAFPNTFSMVAEEYVRFGLLAREPAWLGRAADALAVLPHYHDAASNRVAGGSIASALPVFDNVLSAHLAAVPLLMLSQEARKASYRALAERFLAPRMAAHDPQQFDAGTGIAWHQKIGKDGKVAQKVHWHHVAYVSRALQFLHKQAGSTQARELLLRSIEGLLSAERSGWFPRADRSLLARLAGPDRDIATTAQAVSLLKDAFTLTGEQRFWDTAVRSLQALASSARSAPSPATSGLPLRIPAEPRPPTDSDRYANCWDLCFFLWASRELRSQRAFVTVPLKPKGELRLWTVDGDCLELLFTRNGAAVEGSLQNRSAVPRPCAVRVLRPPGARNARATTAMTPAADAVELALDLAAGQRRSFSITFS